MLSSRVSLQPEITREEAWKLVYWLQDNEVRQYLSDTQDVSFSLMRVLERVNLPVLTHLFNQNGRFFMIYTNSAQAVGFIRLLIGELETEIVLVIGEKQQWGCSLGSSALNEALQIAFYELRTPRVIARIKRSNIRSLRAFVRAGFKPDHDTPAFFCLVLTMDDFLSQPVRKQADRRNILLTELDRYRLACWINQHFPDHFSLNWATRGLSHELSKAHVLDSASLPEDVLSMHAHASLQVNGKPVTVTLSYPHEADWSTKKLSVLSPVGTAILGYREGDTLCWPVPTGFLNIEIKKLLYQPEAAGNYHN